MVERYIFSGSLPQEATTYVTREADRQLYEGLKAGKFCYVLNSRQTGKSSLRVRTMGRLTEEGFSCVAIDLSFGGIQYVTPEQWYVDLLDTLIDSLALSVDLEEWWSDHKLLSPLKRFRKLIEEVLLVEVRENIVIFIDEIDSVLSLQFPTDDFFAFIRACYNQRADNPEFKRLTFCLLGVASPGDLIEDKKRTPFNIGQAISLLGFQLEEVEPLKKGLPCFIGDPTTVMKQILSWTGGQPFLTQKLCQFVVEESDREKPRSVEEIVRVRIIENWESLDEPEHLKTIRDRILYRDEQRAGYLLELYQQILLAGEIPLNDSLEQSELQLSGLVIKRQGQLVVTNPIYREVFNQKWIDEQLASLRPYSENFRFWVASGGKDESRLLRGEALSEAEQWAKNKNLSYQDKEFLAASKNKEIEKENQKAQLEREKKDKEAELERERKAREAAEVAKETLAQANLQAQQQLKRARRQIHIGTTVFVVTLLAAIFSGSLAVWQAELYQKIKNEQKALVKLKERLEQLEESNKEKNLDPSLNGGMQELVFFYYIQAKLLAQQNKPSESRKFYTQAFNLLEKNPYDPNIPNQILSEKNVENIYFQLIKSRNIDINSSNEIAKSFRERLYDGLEFLLEEDRLAEADQKTWEIMLYIAGQKEQGYLTRESLVNFSCDGLRALDKLWYDYPKRRRHFGFRVQKEIWLQNGSPTEDWSKYKKNWRKFYIDVGWKTEESEIESSGGYVRFDDLFPVDVSTSRRGHLPFAAAARNWEFMWHYALFSRDANCNL